MLRNVFVVLLVMTFSLAPLVAGGASEKAPGSKKDAPLKVGMIALVFGTQSFNDDIKFGIDRIQKELGIETISMEVPDVTDTENSLRTLISQGCNFIVVSSSDYGDGMIQVASEYPDVKFLYLADVVVGYDNIMSVSYAENEGAFLIGALAGMLTKTNNVGAVVAIRGDSVQEKYRNGFTAGVQTVNPDCEVQVAYTNSYSDVNKGNEIATAMYSRGADLIGTYAGACNLGVFNAAKTAGADKYCFGAAKGQFEQLPSKIIASLVKPVDEAIFTVVKNYMNNGEFKTDKPLKLGLATRGVLMKYTNLNPELNAMVTAEMRKVLDKLSAGIIDGSINVPGTEDELKSFSYSL